MKICCHFFVSGKVQGVYYRANTIKQAQNLNLTGWVRNLEDGRVEVLACGEETAIEKLHHWLHQGPQAAHVTSVTSEALDYETYNDFIIR